MPHYQHRKSRMKFGQHILRSSRDAITGRNEPEDCVLNLYWYALLIASVLIVVAVFLYGIWGLLRVLNDLSLMANVSGPPPSALNRATLDATVRGFEMRRSQFDLQKATRGEVIPDPSR